MAETPDITTMSPDEIKDQLERHEKPLLCLACPPRIEFLQPRLTTDLVLVADYEGALTNGDKLPPAKGIFVYDLNICKVFDGIHTTTARYNLGMIPVPVLLQLGTSTDADIAAASANHSNGARRTNADKRNAVKILLRNPELGCLTNNRLAEIAKVSAQLVEDVRIELENDPNNPIARPKKRRVIRKGVEYDIDAPATQSTATAKVLPPEKLVQRIVDYLGKQLETQPVEERTTLCGQVMNAIRANYSVD